MKLPKQSAMRVTRTNTTSKAQRIYTPICGIVSTVCAQSWDEFSILRLFFQWLKRPISRQPKKQSELSRDFADEMLKNIEVRGVSFSGQDDNVGVVLTGLFTVSNNQKTAINSPRLKFNTETFGFEEELEEIAANIETEVYAFLFKGKKAQLELFGADGEPAPGLSAEKVEGNGLFPDVDDPADDPEPNDETAEM